MTARQNGGLLIVRDAEGRLVRKVNAVAAAKDWLRLGEAGFYRKYGFFFTPRTSTLKEARRQMEQRK